jgi:predicted GH43/DUF377 family glycosyl hydrolase
MVKMSNTQFKELFIRHKANPIIQARDIPYQPNSVFNAGANRFGDDTLLLMRVEDRWGISRLIAAHSRDGVTDWRIDPDPTLPASTDKYLEGEYGAKS